MSLLSTTLRFGRPMAAVAILAAGVLTAGSVTAPAKAQYFGYPYYAGYGGYCNPYYGYGCYGYGYGYPYYPAAWWGWGGGWGGHRFGGFRGGFHGGGFHGGGFHGGGFHGHGFHGGGFGVLGWPYYAYPYGGDYDPYHGYDTGQPSSSQVWYYCSDPAGYYPYITQCNAGWQTVPAS
jgi:hypothetical protein